MKMSIQARMIGFIFVPCMLGLICLGGLSGYFASDSIHKQNNAAMTEILSRQSSELNNMALLTGDIMESFAGERCVSELLKAAAAGTIPEERRQEAMRLISHMSKVCSTLDQIGILTPEGLVVAHITPASIGTKRSYFSPDGKAHVINTRSGTKREITAVFTVPVMRDGQVIGHVYATTPMKSLAERTIGSFHLYDHSVSGVYDARGTVLMHSDPARQGADDSGKSWVRDMLTKGSGFMTYADEEKQRHLLYFTSLPALGWTIMLDVPAAEAEEPLRTMLYIIAAASVLILLCCGSVIIWITRDMAGSIHDLTSFSLLVADGNLEITPEQQKMLDRHARRSDELGALSRSVGAMARNMGGMVQQAERKTREAEHAALKASEATTRAESASRDAFQALRVQHEAASRLEEVVASVSAAVTQLSTQITSSAQGADNQARRVSETATAMEEMNASVLEVAKNAACTADISEQARQKGPIETTGQLNELISAAIPAKIQKKGGHPSKRTFQALRIECNRELEVLKNSIDGLIGLLNPGGRICIITFHSLEDRIVKTAFRRNENPCTCPPDFPVCICGKKSLGRVITRKPILPSEEEMEENPRSKSAKLRIFEKAEAEERTDDGAG